VIFSPLVMFVFFVLLCLVFFDAWIRREMARERDGKRENEWLMMNTVFMCLRKEKYSNLNDDINQLLPSY
jgi:hypothetical protein